MIIKQSLKENKIVSGFLITLFSLIITWGIWTTTTIYSVKESGQIRQNLINNICSDIDKLQKDVKEINQELKQQRDMIYLNQEKILNQLISIQRYLKQDEFEKRSKK